MTSRQRTVRVLTFNILRDTMLSPAGAWNRRRPAVLELLDSIGRHARHLQHPPRPPACQEHRDGQDIRTILDRDPTGFQILCGDMNSLSSWRAMRTLRGEGTGGRRELVDAWRAAERRRGPSGTLHLGFGIPMPRIDYVFAPPNVRVPHAEVIVGRFEGRFPSDHCALLVELEVPAAVSA